MTEEARQVERLEKEFIMLIGYFIYKYCDNQAELDYIGFMRYLDKDPQLEKMDLEETSYYRVTFNEPTVH